MSSGSANVAGALLALVWASGCTPSSPVLARAPTQWDTIASDTKTAGSSTRRGELLLARFSGGDEETYIGGGSYDSEPGGYQPYRDYAAYPVAPATASFVAATTGPATRMAIRVEGEGAVALATARTLDRSYVALRVCYEALVEQDPSAEGSITVSFVIGKDGKVQKGATTTGTPGDVDLGKCIVKTVSELTFAASGAEAKMSATLDLKVPPPQDLVLRGSASASRDPDTEAEHDVSVLMK